MKRCHGRYAFFMMAALAVWLQGCAPATRPFDEKVPAQALSYIGAPPVSDARPRFREIFNQLLDRRRQRLGLATECDGWLWRLTDEPPVLAEPKPLPEHDPNLRILIVPGAFSNCLIEIQDPYHEGAERLRRIGYPIQRVQVGGLSSSTKNAAIIADVVAKQPLAPHQRLILMGYSKGTTDILHFLVAYPTLARRVSAVLSVAGAVNGSALADRYSEAEYDNWIFRLSPDKCRSGDQGALDSLSRTRQFRWLATHPLPPHVHYFSLATFAKYEDMQLLQRPTYKMLERIHPLNDGQLLFLDQVIPGSTLLGYVNADHWTVAIPVEDKFSNRDSALKERHRKLRELLFEAMVLFLVEHFETHRTS